MKKAWGIVVVLLLLAGTVVYVLMHPKKSDSSVSNVTSGQYIALGDSVAAGVGLTPDSGSSACDRTDQSYAHIIASDKHYSLTNLACSSATLAEGINGGQTVNQLLIKPQLTQLYAVKNPKLITLTIGANDSGWLQLLGKCYQSECGGAIDRAVFQQQVASMQTSLTDTLKQIRAHYSVAPTIVVAGYYRVFPEQVTATCTDLTGIDAQELAWGREMQDSLNNAVWTAVSDAGAINYAQGDFTGHELCTDDPWVQGLTDKQPYHPTAQGQIVIAKQVEAQVSKGKN